MALHILIGTATVDVELIRETSDADHAVDWIVPKDAQLGDDVIFFVQGKGLLGFGVIGGTPEKVKNGHWTGRYIGKVKEVRLIRQPISELRLKEAFPDWAWLRYPRIYTTPSCPIATKLKELLTEQILPEKESTTTIPDRHDSNVARQIIEGLIPNKTQQVTICSDLASYWQYAKRNFPSNTFITLAKKYIRLNIGMIESFVITADYILVVIDKTLVDPTASTHYKSHPDAVPLSLSYPDYIDRSATLRPAVYSMINKLGVTHKHPTAFKAHSPGLVAVLEQSYPYDVAIDFPEQVNEQYDEGSKIQVTVNCYERSVEARAACIRHYGSYQCRICKIDFAILYGGVGKDFIHVHHLKPLSSINNKYSIRPQEDLLPVCPNCHAMLHMRKPEPYSPEELKKMISQQNTQADPE